MSRVVHRRAVPRAELFPSQRLYSHATDPRRCCRATIKLDGMTYGCGREVRANDRQHDGIHDAFADHGDGGAVRW